MPAGFTAGGGQKVGTPDGKKWRCPVCSLVNSLEHGSCKRCREPMDEQKMKKHLLNSSNTDRRTIGEQSERKSQSFAGTNSTISHTASKPERQRRRRNEPKFEIVAGPPPEKVSKPIEEVKNVKISKKSFSAPLNRASSK
eukprot:916972_1